jgi:hypothetical protein
MKAKRIRGHFSEPWPYGAFRLPCVVAKDDEIISYEWVAFRRYHLITLNRKRRTPMSPHLQYLRYVTRHKWFVFLACCRLGIPWRGIVHDLCKFLPCEWTPYVDSFYGPQPRTQAVKESFNRAWLHHQHASPHHWQFWVLRNDDGDTKILPMPDAIRREMVADWRGAGRALGHPDTAAWYAKNRDNIMLHPDTRAWVVEELGS